MEGSVNKFLAGIKKWEKCILSRDQVFLLQF